MPVHPDLARRLIAGQSSGDNQCQLILDWYFEHSSSLPSLLRQKTANVLRLTNPIAFAREAASFSNTGPSATALFLSTLLTHNIVSTSSLVNIAGDAVVKSLWELYNASTCTAENEAAFVNLIKAVVLEGQEHKSENNAANKVGQQLRQLWLPNSNVLHSHSNTTTTTEAGLFLPHVIDTVDAEVYPSKAATDFLVQELDAILKLENNNQEEDISRDQGFSVYSHAMTAFGRVLPVPLLITHVEKALRQSSTTGNFRQSAVALKLCSSLLLAATTSSYTTRRQAAVKEIQGWIYTTITSATQNNEAVLVYNLLRLQQRILPSKVEYAAFLRRVSVEQDPNNLNAINGGNRALTFVLQNVLLPSLPEESTIESIEMDIVCFSSTDQGSSSFRGQYGNNSWESLVQEYVRAAQQRMAVLRSIETNSTNGAVQQQLGDKNHTFIAPTAEHLAKGQSLVDKLETELANTGGRLHPDTLRDLLDKGNNLFQRGNLVNSFFPALLTPIGTDAAKAARRVQLISYLQREFAAANNPLKAQLREDTASKYKKACVSAQLAGNNLETLLAVVTSINTMGATQQSVVSWQKLVHRLHHILLYGGGNSITTSKRDSSTVIDASVVVKLCTSIIRAFPAAAADVARSLISEVVFQCLPIHEAFLHHLEASLMMVVMSDDKKNVENQQQELRALMYLALAVGGLRKESSTTGGIYQPAFTWRYHSSNDKISGTLWLSEFFSKRIHLRTKEEMTHACLLAALSIECSNQFSSHRVIVDQEEGGQLKFYSITQHIEPNDMIDDVNIQTSGSMNTAAAPVLLSALYMLQWQQLRLEAASEWSKDDECVPMDDEDVYMNPVENHNIINQDIYMTLATAAPSTGKNQKKNTSSNTPGGGVGVFPLKSIERIVEDGIQGAMDRGLKYRPLNLGDFLVLEMQAAPATTDVLSIHAKQYIVLNICSKLFDLEFAPPEAAVGTVCQSSSYKVGCIAAKVYTTEIMHHENAAKMSSLTSLVASLVVKASQIDSYGGNNNNQQQPFKKQMAVVNFLCGLVSEIKVSTFGKDSIAPDTANEGDGRIIIQPGKVLAFEIGLAIVTLLVHFGSLERGVQQSKFKAAMIKQWDTNTDGSALVGLFSGL